MNSRTNIDKDDLIKKEINRLKRLYKDLDDKKKKTLEGLIEECAYMRVSLKELCGFIDELGYVDLKEQGSYSIIRESSCYKV